MTTSEQMKRLEALETAARVQRFEESMERDLEAMRPQAEELAAELGCTAEALLADTAAISRRILEIGEEAWEAETAAEFGITVDEFRSRDWEGEWREWQEQDRARRAEVVYWRGGNPPIPYRNGQSVTDGSAGTWR